MRDYRIISTDDHLQEAPDTWTSRMSKAKWGDKIPQTRTNPDGSDGWWFYGEKKGHFLACPSTMPDRSNPRRWDETPKEAYVAADRVKAMNSDGVDVHSLFGNSPIRFQCFSNPEFAEEDFRMECIRAYNDLQIEEYDRPFPGRFISLAMLPLWDVNKAVEEAKRAAKLGMKGLSFAMPDQFKYPHISDKYWDPLWAFAQETHLPVNMHIGAAGDLGIVLRQSPHMYWNDAGTRPIAANQQIVAMLLVSGILERFPKLKIVSAESGIGWVPYLLELADHHWERFRLDKKGMVMKPSEYFHRQVYVNFWFEVIGLERMMYQATGVDNIMWLSDFPHPTSTYPTSQKYIDTCLAKVPAAEQRKFLSDNAVKVYNLEA